MCKYKKWLIFTMVVIPVQREQQKLVLYSKSDWEAEFYQRRSTGCGVIYTVYRGKYKDAIDVAIKRILKEKVISDFETTFMAKIASHPNICRYLYKSSDCV